LSGILSTDGIGRSSTVELLKKRKLNRFDFCKKGAVVVQVEHEVPQRGPSKRTTARRKRKKRRR